MKIPKDSMIYWYPIIEEIDEVKPYLPRTTIVVSPFTDDYMIWIRIEEGDVTPLEVLMYKQWLELIRSIIDEFYGYPVFIRTDHCSWKWYWNKTCVVESPKNLAKNILEIISNTVSFAELPVRAIVIRELLKIKHTFRAFYGLPIGREFRFIAKDGKYLCHGYYWTKKSIEFKEGYTEKPENFDKLYEEISRPLDPEDFKLLKHLSEVVTKALGGAWTIDFAQTEDGKWYLIDMATLEHSWVPPECKHLVK